MSRLAHVMLGSALAVGLAACGGDSGLSKAEYVEAANEICAEADKKTDALPTPTQPADIGPYLDDGVEIQEDALDQLEELEAPADDADQIQSELIDPYRALVKEVRAVRGEVEEAGNDQAAVLKSLEGLQEIDTDKANDFALEYGLDQCADSPEGETGGGSGEASSEASPSAGS